MDQFNRCLSDLVKAKGVYGMGRGVIKSSTKANNKLTKTRAKNIIKKTIETSITEFTKKKKKKTNKKEKFQILDLLIPKQRKIRLAVGGLEGSLGTTLWEPLAKSLAKENGFKIIDSNLQCPANMPSNLNNMLQTIIDDRKNRGGMYDADSSHKEIKRICQAFVSKPIDKFQKAPRGRGVDIWLIKNRTNYLFDTKTVQPNLSSLTGYMEQVLYWYAYFYAKNPKGKAVARIVFPYNPTPDKSFWDGVTGKGKPLQQKKEAWVEGEFWDFCSGLSNTFDLIKSCFIDLRKSGKLVELLNPLFE